eukprot:12864977-Ditylum_brightwellii.AAC.1
MEGYPPKYNNIIESLFEKHVTPLMELLQSALQDPTKNFAHLLLTTANNVKKCIENAHWFRADPSLIPRSAKFGFKLTAPRNFRIFQYLKFYQRKWTKS